MNNQKEMLVALTVDTDADEYWGNLAPKRLPGDKKICGWKGLEKGKDYLIAGLQGIKDSFGERPRLTWFIRCDRQIGIQFGNYGYLLHHFDGFWNKRLDEGDDIQWHAHLYRIEREIWVQEDRPDKLAEDLQGGFAALKDWGLAPTAIRIGESYQSNELMSLMESLGLKSDFSGLAGRKRQDGEKWIDWEITPNHPYHPSRADYRTPGEPAYPFWEVPLNTVVTRVSYDTQPVLRYVNLGFQPGVLDRGLESFLNSHNILVSVTHPFELVSDFFSDSSNTRHPLLSFHPDAVRKNLAALFRAAETCNKKIRFVTVAELLNQLGY
jgi:hypothetical protein